MKILAIETSCDETAIAIIDVKKNKKKVEFQILGSEVATQIDIHKEYGGVFPMMAKREHNKNIIPVLKSALKKAKMYNVSKSQTSDWKNAKNQKKTNTILERETDLQKAWVEIMPFIKKPKIDLITVTSGPGLEPALWVGISFAKALSVLWDKPIVPVNHMEGHIFSVFPKNGKKFEIDMDKKIFPMLSLLVSGGHTEIVLMKDWMKYKKLGQTRDDAVGEAFDKVARMLGLTYPGGPEISRLAENEREINISSDPLIKLPRPMIYSKDYDFSFSGLKTAVLYMIRDLPKDSFDEKMKSKIAREFEDSAIEVLTHKTMRAIKEFKIKTLVVGGGVSANQHLRQELSTSIKKIDKNINLYLPSKNLSTDNALMIAIAGYFRYQNKAISKNINKIVAEGNLSL